MQSAVAAAAEAVLMLALMTKERPMLLLLPLLSYEGPCRHRDGSVTAAAQMFLITTRCKHAVIDASCSAKKLM